MKYKEFSFYKSLMYLENQPNTILFAVSFTLVILLGVIDYLTGFELSFSIFYLVPVSIAAWGIGRDTGYAISVLSAIAWITSNILAGQTYSNSLIAIWNTVMRLGVFALMTTLLHTLRVALNEERNLARTDPLTGALNRRAFYDIIANRLLMTQRNPQPNTLAYFDLDNFKQVNDLMGHETGDEVLKEVVTVIQANIRTSDFLSRLGGDEFALFLSDTGHDVAKKVIARLQDILLAAMQSKNWNITFSIGVLIFLVPPASVNEMIKRADNLMYRVKTGSKNAIVYDVYSEENET